MIRRYSSAFYSNFPNAVVTCQRRLLLPSPAVTKDFGAHLRYFAARMSRSGKHGLDESTELCGSTDFKRRREYEQQLSAYDAYNANLTCFNISGGFLNPLLFPFTYQPNTLFNPYLQEFVGPMFAQQELLQNYYLLQFLNALNNQQVPFFYQQLSLFNQQMSLFKQHIPLFNQEYNFFPQQNLLFNQQIPFYNQKNQQTPLFNQRIPRTKNGFRKFSTNKTHKTGQLFRSWEKLQQEAKHKPDHFAVMSYNVLAQDLLDGHRYLYERNDPHSLPWEIRRRNLIFEIKNHNCDILCLQEIQDTHKEEFFDESLGRLGYDGIYKQRTGDKTDGCAIYYKRKKFKLLDHISVEYYQPRVDLLNRDNIGIIAKFSSSVTDQQFIVANTHLLFNPNRQDIRLAQTQLLFTEIDRIAYTNKNNNKYKYLPVIVTGDFNSTPCSSVIKFIIDGSLQYEKLSPRTLNEHSGTSPNGKILVPSFLKITDNCKHINLESKRDSVTRKEENQLINLYHSENKPNQPYDQPEKDSKNFSTGTLSHEFSFKSVYDIITPGGTTFQNKWVVVDHIFYNSANSDSNNKCDWGLTLLSRYEIPSLECLQPIALPNSQLGSDHLCLIAKFSLKKLI